MWKNPPYFSQERWTDFSLHDGHFIFMTNCSSCHYQQTALRSNSYLCGFTLLQFWSYLTVEDKRIPHICRSIKSGKLKTSTLFLSLIRDFNIWFICLTGLSAWDPLPPTAVWTLGDPEEKPTPTSPPPSSPPPPPHSRAHPWRSPHRWSWRRDSGLRWSLHDGWGGPGELSSLPHQSGLWR